MGEVELLNMEFYAYHGCFKEERVIGNKFLVSYIAETEVGRAGESDNINDAVNYQELYQVIEKEMMIASNLLESVALRIHRATATNFPSIVRATVKISKLNPPIGGKVEASRVSIRKNYR